EPNEPNEPDEPEEPDLINEPIILDKPNKLNELNKPNKPNKSNKPNKPNKPNKHNKQNKPNKHNKLDRAAQKVRVYIKRTNESKFPYKLPTTLQTECVYALQIRANRDIFPSNISVKNLVLGLATYSKQPLENSIQLIDAIYQSNSGARFHFIIKQKDITSGDQFRLYIKYSTEQDCFEYFSKLFVLQNSDQVEILEEQQ